MSDVVAQALERLQTAGVRFDPGLSDTEVSRIEAQFGFTFGPEHRQLLQSAVPAGEPSWPDWRNAAVEELQGRLDWPVDGVIFDVLNNAFWPSSWDERPADDVERKHLARSYLARVPRLVPLYSHRYLTVNTRYQPSPIFSVHQADVVYFGDDLLDYVAHEFKVPPLHPSLHRTHVPFWSDLADGSQS